MTYLPQSWLTGPPVMPRSLAIAVRLMYAGAALEFLGVVFDFADLRHVAIGLSATHGYTMSEANSIAWHGLRINVAGVLISAGVWLWMARATAEGRTWARTISTMLFGLFTLVALATGLTRSLNDSALSFVVWFVALGATVCIWRRDSSHYFAECRRNPPQYVARPPYF